MAVFCDDLRAEVGNKISLMGMYSEGLSFDVSPPVLLPRLCGMVWLISKLDNPPPFVSVRITIPPNRSTAYNSKFTVGPPSHFNDDGDVKNVRYGSLFTVFNLHLTEPGYVEAFVDVGSGEERAGRLKLIFPETQPVSD